MLPVFREVSERPESRVIGPCSILFSIIPVSSQPAHTAGFSPLRPSKRPDCSAFHPDDRKPRLANFQPVQRLRITRNQQGGFRQILTSLIAKFTLTLPRSGLFPHPSCRRISSIDGSGLWSPMRLLINSRANSLGATLAEISMIYLPSRAQKHESYSIPFGALHFAFVASQNRPQPSTKTNTPVPDPAGGQLTVKFLRPTPHKITTNSLIGLSVHCQHDRRADAK
jgi:hypothetical protein